jgi:hypothetical protein
VLVSDCEDIFVFVSLTKGSVVIRICL